MNRTLRAALLCWFIAALCFLTILSVNGQVSLNRPPTGTWTNAGPNGGNLVTEGWFQFKETGGAKLRTGAIPDGYFMQRSGTNMIGGIPGAAGQLLTVQSLAALAALNPSLTNFVILADGPRSGTFYGTNTVAGTNYTTTGPGTRYLSTTPGWSWERLYSGHVMLGWFGAKSDGTVTTNEVDAALNYMRTLRGGTLELWPLGTYRANWLITPDLGHVRIVGGNQNDSTETNSVVLVAADYTRPVVQLGDGTGLLRGFTLENVAIRAREGSSNAPAALYIYGGVTETFIKQFGFIGGANTIDVKALGDYPSTLIYFIGGNAWEGTNSTIRVTRPTGDNYVTGIYFDHFYLNGHNTSGFAAISDRGLINFDNFYADTMDGHGFATTNSGGYITTFNTTLESDTAEGVLFTAQDDSFKELTRYVQGGGKMIGKIRYADASTEDIPQIQGLFRNPLIFSPQITTPIYLSSPGSQFSRHNVFDEVTTGGPLRYINTNGQPFIFQSGLQVTNSVGGPTDFATMTIGSRYARLQFGANTDELQYLYIDPTGLTSQPGVLALGRNTDTSAGVVMQIFRGDGTATVQSEIASIGNSYLNAQSGTLGVGTASPSAAYKLDVAGTIGLDKLVPRELNLGMITNGGTITFNTTNAYYRADIAGATFNFSSFPTVSSNTQPSIFLVYSNSSNGIQIGSSPVALWNSGILTNGGSVNAVTNQIGESGTMVFTATGGAFVYVSKSEPRVSGGSDDQTAAEVPFTPTGTVAATDVQAAIAEVDSEKAPIASPIFTGTVIAPTLSANATTLGSLVVTNGGTFGSVTVTTNGSFGGSVGIGNGAITSSVKLDVFGDSISASNSYVRTTRGANTADALFITRPSGVVSSTSPSYSYGIGANQAYFSFRRFDGTTEIIAMAISTNGGVSIGDTTDPGAGSLRVTGNTTLGDAAGDTVTLNAGTLTLANDLAVTLSGGVNGLNFATNTLSIDAANGRVGIGTATPAAPLDVNGNVIFRSSDGNGLAIYGTSTGTANVSYLSFNQSNGTRSGYFGDGSGATENIALVADTGTLSLRNNANEVLTVTQSSTVGIGTTSPERPLDVNSETGLGIQTTYNDSNGSAANYVRYQVTSSGDATITPSGGDANIVGRVNGSLGISSTATDTAVNISATGWTNTFGKNAVVMLEGVGVTYTIYNNAGTAVYTNVATVVNASIPLQVSGKVIVTAGTGVSGTAFPW